MTDFTEIQDKNPAVQSVCVCVYSYFYNYYLQIQLYIYISISSLVYYMSTSPF